MGNDKFLKLEDAARLIGKSYSSMRVIIRKLRQENEFDIHCKKEGKNILIKEAFLRQNYDIEEKEERKESDEVEFLREQLREKDRQIKSITEALNRYGKGTEKLYEFLGGLGIKREFINKYIEVQTIDEHKESEE